jgi:predicted Zn-dependent protease
MPRMRCFAAMAFCLLSAVPLLAQKEKREPLTGDQIEQIREAGIYPDDRVKLYMKFLDEHAEAIKGLAKRAKSAARSRRLDDELQDFTALMDELGANLDTFSDRKADIRKSLKPLPEATERWLAMLRALPGEPVFDLARKEAIESGEDLTDQATRLLQEQTQYFKEHKDEQGQDRAEPK